MEYSSFFTERQRSPAAPCAPYGGTPCWAVHLVFGCSALAHCSQCDSVVAFLCIVDVEGPVHVRQPVIHMPNVRGQGTRHLVTGTLDPLVGRYFIKTLKMIGSAMRAIIPAMRANSPIIPITLAFPVCNWAVSDMRWAERCLR